MELHDHSDVGIAYTKMYFSDACESPSTHDMAVAKLRFELYHTTTIDDKTYALHEAGVLEDGTVVCCSDCGRGLRQYEDKMQDMMRKSNQELFFKYDPTVTKNKYVREHNQVRLAPIKDTWIDWDYGKVISYFVDETGNPIIFKDENGDEITIDDLSSAEVQSVSPLLVDSKIIKITSRDDKHVGQKIIGHILTLPTSSNREIYKSSCTALPRMDVAEYNRILYLGTLGKYTSHVAFRLNSKRNALRQGVVEDVLKGMRQANERFAECTRFESPSVDEWQKQVHSYQHNIIDEPHKSAQQIEEAVRSDVTKGWDTNMVTSQTDISADAEFTHVMVTADLTKDPDEQLMHSMLCLYDEIKQKDSVDGAMPIHIQNKPVNEYTNSPELLHLAFPLLFPLGITWRQIRSCGLMKQGTIRRLLCSSDGRFARNKSFLFTINNQKMRHQNNLSASLRIDTNTEMSTKFVEFINSEEYDRLCIAAAANPKGKEARVLLSKIRPMISISGTSTKWSPLERAACKGKLFSMAQTFSPFALFATLSPKALDCDLVIKNAAAQLGLTDDEHIEKLKLPSGLNERVRMVSENPVAQARAFQHIIDGFCKIIVGYGPDKIQKGIFGTPLSFFGPIETQHRGTLHLHLQIQIKELNPALIERFADDPKMMNKFVSYINSTVVGTTRGFEHIEMQFRKRRRTKSSKSHSFRATKILVSKIKTKNSKMSLQKGDPVLRTGKRKRGTFVGFVNKSKTKCVVNWHGDNRCKREKDVNSNKKGCVNDPDTDKCSNENENVTYEEVKVGDLKIKMDVNSNKNGCVVDRDTDKCCSENEYIANEEVKKRDSKIKVGDLIFDRCGGETKYKPAWLVVTQGPHRRGCCECRNKHSHTLDSNGYIVEEDPLLVTVMPALFGIMGVTNTPDLSREAECWRVNIYNEAHKVSKVLEHGYRVMCRDNYHECLISCRKYKKTLRAQYCRMRRPQRPMEYTCFSQLYVPDYNVCTLVSTTPNLEKRFVARPLKNLKQKRINQDNLCNDYQPVKKKKQRNRYDNVQQFKKQHTRWNDYWDENNTDVLSVPNEKALVLDLCRLSGKRAMSDEIREKVVPSVMCKLLQLLPSAEPEALTEVTFKQRPFGFTFGPTVKGVIVTSVKKGSAAAEAGVEVGMPIIKINGVRVDNEIAEHVRGVIKDLDPPCKISFRLPLPFLELPGVYHVKHRSMVIAASIVSHIESFLGFTHVYEDGRMTETNVFMASFLNCNTNVQLVGSMTAAMAILQYLSGYLSKNPVELCNFISCIIAARRRCKIYKSTAEDEGTESRNAKFLAQKVNCCYKCALILVVYSIRY